MTTERRKLRWNGWGLAHASFDLGSNEATVWAYIAAALGRDKLVPHPAVPLPEIHIPATRLADDTLGALQDVVGSEHLKTDRFERAFHARGKSYLDLLAVRAGELGEQVPDAVVYPGDAEEVQGLVDLALTRDLALVPFGGGSSVVGGVTASRGAHQAVITVDMTRMRRLLTLDEVSHCATLEAGVYGPDLEQQLQSRGYTLGHYPQSFEFSTLGGWVAARGAGQQSNRYGKAEKWLLGARLATPRGAWHTESFPASAVGPNTNQFVLGSEGTLGIITEATVRIHPVPAHKDYRGYLFRSFAEGAAAIREIVQRQIPVAMLRLSDASETHFLQTFSAARHPPGVATRLGSRVVAMRGYGEGRCLLLVGLEGEHEAVLEAQVLTRSACERHNGLGIGSSPGTKWYAGRFMMPYLRDPLLDRGVAVETLETATRWANILPLYHDIDAALRESLRANAAAPGDRAIVMCHISHAYEDGASLYFTTVFPQRLADSPAASAASARAQWLAVKQAATDAMLTGGGTVSHHHGVGTDHVPWLAREKGPVGLAALTAIKHSLDPDGAMNPGKLLPIA
ncbi:MAG: FAD-binding oxidoreductase [Myxococcales bacterium]|nr:FAD-binding oxidoreductase [Myxococcales bacterium]